MNFPMPMTTSFVNDFAYQHQLMIDFGIKVVHSAIVISEFDCVEVIFV
jgi:hypothetical protein